MSNLWVFGHSFCLPYNIDVNSGWDSIVGDNLGLALKNYAQEAADNFFIFHTYLENIQHIQPDDTVIIGWSHPSRKTFVLDYDNPEQTKVLSNSLHYKTQTKEFIRSNNTVPDSKEKFASMALLNKGTAYYDNWFKNYYNEYEQSCNFQAYHDSVNFTVPCQYLPFYFSKDSVTNIKTNNQLYMLDFVINNHYEISKDDGHANEIGHKHWAEILINCLTTI